MMTILQIKEQLKTAKYPVAKALHHGTNFNVIVIGFNKGMILQEHQTRSPAKLTVLEGVVLYKKEEKTVQLNQYDEVDIPIELLHSVEALEDSLCLLTKGE